MPLYHIEVFMPRVMLPQGVYPLKYTAHAMTAAQTDRYGNIPLPITLNTREYRVIEVETDNNKNVIKVVYKGILDEKRDIAIVCIPEGRTMKVKTVWANQCTDKHKTLDHSRYAKS